MGIEELALSVRAYNAVKRYGINTTEELADRIDEFCKHSSKFGAEAREALSKVSAPQPSGVIVESAEYTKAVKLHRCICANAQAAQDSLYEMCKALKEMHDQKLYRELGYNSFEDYTEKEVGIRKVQAYKYVAIGSAENVHSSEHLGVTKLALLAKLDEPQREEIQQNVDLENTSVKELKAEIEKLKTKETGYKERQDKLLQKNKELVSDIEKGNKERAEIFDKLERTEGERDRLEDDLDEAKDTIKSLEQQLEELENKPRDSYEDTTKIDELKKQLAEAEKRAAESNKSAHCDNVVFNAYAAAATDAMKRLTQFCERNSSSSEKSIFISKLKVIIALTEQTIEKMGG